MALLDGSVKNGSRLDLKRWSLGVEGRSPNGCARKHAARRLTTTTGRNGLTTGNTMWKARSKRLVVLALWGCVFILLGEIADVYPWVDIIGDILIVVAILILLGIYVWQGDN